ncbi:MAG: ATP-binding protein [Actinomycetota bacterium]|nr:ATP-binding protein [Actinomycetota bacterium]
MSVDDLRAIALFDGLSNDQLLELMTAGEELRFSPGEELFREAQPADSWWVLLEGTISLMRRVGHEETVLRVMDSPGQWAGGFQAWDAHGVYLATGRGAMGGRVLRVPAELLGDLANAWFPFGVHLIRGLVHTVRNIESAARQREALVALGTLAAGLAHEINNPASAATRAVDALEDTSEALMSSLGRLAEGSISAAQFVALDTLRREIEPQSLSMEPLAVADREDVLSDWLMDHGVERDWLIAPPFAAAGIDITWCERVAALLDGDPLEAGLEWVASSLSMATLLSEVKESTRRISDLVAAVKSYSQLDRASMQHMDLTEGIESTLIMLAHKLQDGVTVVRDYGNDVPRIEAFAGELNQVWTNLIDNAIDAMKGTGTLRVSTRVNEKGVVVEIGNTGPGMPKEVQARAFEPFYTTKDVGKGTGLGLDISRRIIVERHGGEITIESRPDETVLRVRLPLRATTTP